MPDSVRPHRRQTTRLPRPWDSPGKNTGVGCHFLLQCMQVKSESEVAQSCLTLSDPMDCSPPGSSVHGIFQARVLEWGAIAFSICLPTRFYLIWAPSTILVISFASLLLCTLAQAVKSSLQCSEERERDRGDSDSVPGLGRSPEGGNGNPHQYSCLEKPMD